MIEINKNLGNDLGLGSLSLRYSNPLLPACGQAGVLTKLNYALQNLKDWRTSRNGRISTWKSASVYRWREVAIAIAASA